MASELFPTKRFIYSELAAATGLTVHKDAAPESATRPFVRFTVDTRPHLTTMNGKRVMSPLEFTAFVVGEGSAAPLGSYVAAIEERLSWLVNREPEEGWFIHQCLEVSSVELPVYYFAGTPIYEIGSQHRLTIQRLGAAVV